MSAFRFRSIEQRSGISGLSKAIDPAEAWIEKRALYLGRGNFRVKASEMAGVELREDGPRALPAIVLHVQKGSLAYVLEQEPRDASGFDACFRQLTALYEKNQPSVHEFLEKSSGKALGARPPPPRRAHRAFGRGATTAPSRPAAADDFVRGVFGDPAPRPAKRLRQQVELEARVDFSEDEASVGPGQAEAQVNESKIEADPPTEPEAEEWSEHSSDEDPPFLSNNTRQIATTTGTAAVTKNAGSTTRKHRLQIKLRRDSDSEDDDIFNDSKMTTPISERHVTPGTRSLPKVGKGTLTAFFGAKKPPTELPQTGPAEDSSREGTPTRRRTPSPPRFRSPSRYTRSPHSARIVKQSIKKNELTRSEQWLLGSPTRPSADEQARLKLFGSRSPLTPVRGNSRLPFKPVRENVFASSPRSDEISEPTVPGAGSAFGPSSQRGRLMAHGSKGLRLSRWNATSHDSATGTDGTERSLDRPRLDFRPSRASDEETPAEKPIFRFRGIYNLGNSCYMAASLQMLVTATDFIQQLRKHRGGRLTTQLLSVADKLSDTSEHRSVGIEGVKAAMDAISDKFAGYLQRDAHEFLSDLVDNVHEELEKDAKSQVGISLGSQSKTSDIILEASGLNDEINSTTAEAGTVNTSSSSEDMENGEQVDTASTLVVAADSEEQQSIAPGEQHQGIDKNSREHACPMSENKSTVGSTETALPTDDFRLTVRVCLKCESCGYTRSKEEIYRHVSIDVCSEIDGVNEPSGAVKASVAAGLSRFFQPEVREIKCENCTSGTHASQCIQIVSRPQYLIIHLKRFIWMENKIHEANDAGSNENAPPNRLDPPRVEYTFKKKKDPVILSTTLELTSYRSPDVDWSSNSTNYSLKSIVYHHGRRPESGHYTADALRFLPQGISLPEDVPTTEANPVWVTFDDSSTALTTLEKVASSPHNQERAYILLYGMDA